jgi:O-antigen/teichoic acid export membrane protein
VLTSLWSLAVAVIGARRLDTASFGRLALLLSAQVVVSTVMTSAIGQTAVRLTAELRERDQERLNRVVTMLGVISTALSVLVMVVFLAGGSLTHDAALGPGAPRDAILGAGIVLLAAGVSALQQGLLSGWGFFDAVAYINAARLAVGGVMLLLGPPTLSGAVTALAAGAAAGMALGEWLWRTRCAGLRRVPRVEWSRELAVLWTFAVPSWLTGALFVVSAWLGNVLVSHQANGLPEVGVFNAASQWGRSLLLFVPNAVASPLLVTMSALWGRGDLPSLAKVTRKATVACILATVVPCAMVYGLGSFLLGWYGPAYARALPVLHILLLSTTVASITIVTNAALTAAGRVWTVAGLTAVWAVIFLIMLLVAPTTGAIGLALAYLAGYIVQVAVTAPHLVRVLRPAAA